MRVTPEQFLEIQQRLAKGRRKGQPEPEAPPPSKGTQASVERDLRDEIDAWCGRQWPRWKVISARTDVPSTIAVGAHDMTVFGPYPLCVCVELKRPARKGDSGGKLRPEQAAWAAEMRMLGWRVAVVRSMAEWHAAVAAAIDGEAPEEK